MYSVEASMLQIYNENIDCLLGADRERAQGLQVTGKSEVRGLTWMPCKTPTDLLQCFQKGRNNLVYAETKMNKASSRSHAVFQIKVAKRPRASDAAAAKKGAKKVEMKAVFGKLTVVDLAGSERIKKSGVVGQQLREATNINSSLLAFGNIVQALAEKKNFIPYRDSKTHENSGRLRGGATARRASSRVLLAVRRERGRDREHVGVCVQGGAH